MKGGKKKVSTNKLLNRKKNPKVGMVKAEKLIGGDSGKGGAIVKSGSSDIVPSQSLTNIKKTETKDMSSTLMVIKVKILEIDSFFKGTFAEKKNLQRKERKSKEKVERAEDEQEIEGAPKTDRKKFNLPLPKQVTSFWGEITRYFSTVLLGWLVVRLVDWLPKLMPILKLLGKFVEFGIWFGGAILNTLITAIHWGFKAFEWTRGVVGKVFGEKGLKVFDGISGVLNTVLNSTMMLALAMIAFSNQFGAGLGGWGRSFMSIFKHGILRSVPRLLIKLFGKKTAAAILGKGVTTAATATTAGGTAAGGGGTAASTAGGIGAGTATGIVAGAGLLASGLGEGMFQLKKQSQNSEDRSYTKFKNASWWNPMKYLHGAIHLGDKFNSFLIGTVGGLLDIVGTPFRYLIELVRYPFLDEAGKKKQNENMAKFDARIREHFREMVHAFSLGILAKDKGAFGSLFGDKGTDAMGYTEDGGKRQSTKAPQGGTILLSTPNLRLTNLLLQDMPGKRLVHTIEKTTKTPKKVNENEKVDNKNKDKMASPWWKFWGDGKDDPSIDRKKLMKNGENVVKKSSTSSKKVYANFDINTGKAYINNEEVSVEEYTKFHNLSQKEKIQQYGRSEGNGNNITPFDVNSVAKKAENISMNTSYQEGGQQEQLVVIPDTGQRNVNNTGGNVVEKPILQVIGGSGGDDPYSDLYEGG